MKVLRIIRNIFFVLIGLLLIAAGIVYFKKDALIRSAVDSAGETMALKIEYKDAGLAFFSTFPNVGISFDSIVVSDPAKSDGTLADISELTMGIDFWSLFSDKGYELKEIILDRPQFNFFCRKDTSCNYDMLFESEEDGKDTTTSQPMRFSIDRFSINDGSISYVDSLHAMIAKITDWNFDLSGNYQEEVLNADISQDKMIIHYISDGVNYVDSVDLTGNGGVVYNVANGQIDLSENQWSLNALKIDLQGMVKILDEGYETDITMNLPSNEFKPLLSLIPAIYQKDFDEVKAEGQFTLEGSIKGMLNIESEVYPAMQFSSHISNGSFRYPDLPQAVTNIRMQAEIDKEEGSLDLLTVNVDPFQFNIGSESKVNGNILLKSLISNPYAAGALHANASLEAFHDVFPMEDIQKLAGQINIDAEFDLYINDLVENRYEQINLQGSGQVNSFVYKVDGQPEVSIDKIDVGLDPQGVKAIATTVKAGSSDISDLRVSTGNLGLYFSDEKAFPIDIKANANRIDVNEWMYAEESDPEEEVLTTDYNLNDYVLSWDVRADRFVYDVYELRNVESKGNMRNDRVTLSPNTFEYQRAAYTVSGTIDDVTAYMSGSKALSANLTINGGRFDLWEYMNSEPEDPTASTTEEEYFTLPEDISLKLTYNLAGIDYDKINFNSVKGSFQLQQGQLDIASTNLKGMGGDVNIEGVFKTEKGSPPFYDMNVAMQSLQFSNTFNSFITVQKIAPLIGRLKGIFDARLSTAGSLDKELFPRISDLDAQGFLETKRAELQGYEPLSRIDQVAGTKFSTDFPLQNTKNWFAIENGALVVEPFNFMVGQDEWSLEGRHVIGGEMNYQFTGPIPMEEIRKSPDGRKIVDEANRILKQIPLTSDYSLDKVDVTILLSGTRTNPKVSLRLANDFKEQLRDRIAGKIREEKEEVKEEVRKEVKKTKEELEKSAKEKAREILTGKKDSVQTQPLDSLKKRTEDKLNKAKKKLQKWDPFKNKNR